MADIIKRLHYFNGQFLEESDFNDEQAYHLDRQRRHNRLLHTPGIAEGLTVTGNAGAGEVNVGMGTALDGQGRMLVLANGQNLVLNNVAGQTVFVVLSYEEVGTDPATVGNQGEATRWEERPKLELVAQGSAPPESTHIRLARVVVTGGGTVSSIDTTVRRSAGVRVGSELSLPRLRFSSDQLQEAEWPEVKADGNRKVEVNDHLEVTGNLTAGSVTTGGAVTAASLSTAGNLAVNNVTASGTVTAGTFTTAGTLNANKVSSTGAGASITTTGAVTAGSFTTTGNLSVAAITASGTVTAGSFTTNGSLFAREITTNTLNFTDLTIPGALTVGTDLTVGGRISGTLAKDTVQAENIVFAAVTTEKLADQAVTTNEIRDHAVNNAKLSFGAVSLDRLDEETRGLVAGALLVKDYDLRKRALATVTFTTQENHGATKPVSVPFRPVLILVSGFIAAIGHEVATNGYVDASGLSVSQKGWGVDLRQNSSAPFLKLGGTQATGSCARAHFYDTTTSPFALETGVEVTVESVTSSGLVVRVIKTNSMQQSVITPSSVTLNFICFGE